MSTTRTCTLLVILGISTLLFVSKFIDMHTYIAHLLKFMPLKNPTVENPTVNCTLVLSADFDTLTNNLNVKNTTLKMWAKNIITRQIDMDNYLGTDFDIRIISVKKGSVKIDYQMVNVTNIEKLNQAISHIKAADEIVDYISNSTYPIEENTQTRNYGDQNVFVSSMEATELKKPNVSKHCYVSLDTNKYFIVPGDPAGIPAKLKTGIKAGDFSVFCWIKPKDIDNIHTVLYQRDRDENTLTKDPLDYTYTGDTVWMTINHGMLNVKFNRPNNMFKITQHPTQLTISKWYHVGFTRSGQNVTAYVNGNAAPTTISDANAAAFGSSFLIGARKEDEGEYAFRGGLDGWTLFDVSLSPKEVDELYKLNRTANIISDQKYHSKRSNVIQYLRFGKGVGSSWKIIFDESPNGNRHAYGRNIEMADFKSCDL